MGMMMRRATALILGISGAGLLLAQEPPLPSPTDTPSTSPAPSVRPELNIPDIPVAPVEPTPLVPNVSAPSKKSVPPISELDAAFQHSSLGAAVEEQKLHLEWRKLKNRVAADPAIVDAKKAADAARTDLEKRDLMRTYYKIYYGRMQALAETAELKAYLEQKKKELINGLAQPHVRPEPTPRPSAKR
jgi:hypothetical protein